MESFELSFSNWTDDDLPEIIAMIRSDEGDEAAPTLEYLDWLFRRNPAGRATIFCCHAPDDGSIVSLYAVVPIPMKLSGAPLKASMSLMTRTRNDYRRRGLFVKGAELVYSELKCNGIAFTYGFANRFSYPGFVGKLGFGDLGGAVLVRPLDPSSMLDIAIPSMSWLGMGRIGRFASRKIRSRRFSSLDIKILKSFDGIEVERLHEKTGLMVNTSVEWLNWRYVARPGREFSIAIVAPHNMPSGLLVYTIVDMRKQKVAIIMDMLLAPEAKPDTVGRLLNHLLGVAEAEGVAAVLCMSPPGSRKTRYLIQSGFWRVPRKANAVVVEDDRP